MVDLDLFRALVWGRRPDQDDGDLAGQALLPMLGPKQAELRGDTRERLGELLRTAMSCQPLASAADG